MKEHNRFVFVSGMDRSLRAAIFLPVEFHVEVEEGGGDNYQVGKCSLKKFSLASIRRCLS